MDREENGTERWPDPTCRLLKARRSVGCSCPRCPVTGVSGSEVVCASTDTQDSGVSKQCQSGATM